MIYGIANKESKLAGTKKTKGTRKLKKRKTAKDTQIKWKRKENREHKGSEG